MHLYWDGDRRHENLEISWVTQSAMGFPDSVEETFGLDPSIVGWGEVNPNG